MIVEEQKTGTPSAARQISIGFITVAAALVLLTACSNMLTLNPNREPVVNITEAGGVTLYPGNSVTLDATESFDPDGQRLTAAWAVTTQPGSGDAVLTGADTFTPTFSAFRLGTYTLTLTVTDEYNVQRTGTATITVANDPPGANAGGNLLNSDLSTDPVIVGDPRIVLGTGGFDDESSPPRRQDLWEFQWEVTRRPWTVGAAQQVLLDWTTVTNFPDQSVQQGGEAHLPFTPPEPGVYTLRLTVRDEGQGAHWGRDTSRTIIVETAGNGAPELNPALAFINSDTDGLDPGSGGIRITGAAGTATDPQDDRLDLEWRLRVQPLDGDGNVETRFRINPPGGQFQNLGTDQLLASEGTVSQNGELQPLVIVPEDGELAFVAALPTTDPEPVDPWNIRIELIVSDRVLDDAVFVYLNWTTP